MTRCLTFTVRVKEFGQSRSLFIQNRDPLDAMSIACTLDAFNPEHPSFIRRQVAKFAGKNKKKEKRCPNSPARSLLPELTLSPHFFLRSRSLIGEVSNGGFSSLAISFPETLKANLLRSAICHLSDLHRLHPPVTLRTSQIAAVRRYSCNLMAICHLCHLHLLPTAFFFTPNHVHPPVTLRISEIVAVRRYSVWCDQVRNQGARFFPFRNFLSLIILLWNQLSIREESSIRDYWC